MPLAVVRSATLFGVEGRPVSVELHLSQGLPGFTVVGLPDTAIREARDRVRAAILSSGLDFPQRRYTVNLAPSALRKSGTGLDLAVAAGVLLATDQIPAGCLDGVGVVGELGLDGSVREVPGTLALVAALHDAGARRAVVPASGAGEAALVPGVTVLPVADLGSLRACLKGEAAWEEVRPTLAGAEAHPGAPDGEPDLSDLRGLPAARAAAAACAAGGHHLLLVGPPGVGKTMLARRIPSILPPLDDREAFEVTRIQSATGAAPGGLVRRRPIRSPHHSASTVALVGGGSGRVEPGEATRAHRGLLLLDELGEFAPTALDALRQPLEERVVRVSRQAMSLTLPAAFTLVATSNPCPCGLGPPGCACDDARRARYRRRLSAPLLDRFDLRVAVARPDPEEPRGERSSEVRARVLDAVARQRRRFEGRPWRRNAEVPAGALGTDVPLVGPAADALREVAEGEGITGRGVDAVRRVARTLADLDGAPGVDADHVVLAADYRREIFE